MPSAEDFLTALDLPAEHPYIFDINEVSGDKTTQENGDWSITSYFSSVQWKDQQQAQIKDEFISNTIPPWAKSSNDLTCQHQHVAHPTNHTERVEKNTVDFLQDIKPCLLAMFRMNLIIWAPIILLLCMKRLSTTNDHRVACNDEPTVDTSRSHATLNNDANSRIGRLPSLPVKPNNQQEKQMPMANQGSSFGRFLFLLCLIPNIISLMASASPIFSIKEEKRDEVPNHRQRSGSTDSVSYDPSCSTFDWMVYLVALVISAFISVDAMYVYEFSQRALVSFHIFVISVAMRRFGSKVALWTALPISAMAIFYMTQQDLNLSPIEPGLYYDNENELISTAVKNWPLEKRSYIGGTPWMINGDTKTGFPFLVNDISSQEFTRRWIPLPDEREALILDIAFPET